MRLEDDVQLLSFLCWQKGTLAPHAAVLAESLSPFYASLAGDAFSPNPGNKAPQGPFPTCPATSAPYTTANPYYVCDSKGECGELQTSTVWCAAGKNARRSTAEVPASYTEHLVQCDPETMHRKG